MKNTMKIFAAYFDPRLPAALLLAAPLALLPGCKKETAPEAVVTVQAAPPERGAITESIEADAVLAPVAQAAIVPKINAPVAKFYVERGQRVHAGQLLAVLENGDLKAAALDSQGAYEAAQATFATTTQAQIPEERLKAEADMAQARANLKLNQGIVKSRKHLFAEGAIPGRDLDTAEAALVQAQAIYDAAKKHLDAMSAVTHAASLKQAQGNLLSAEARYKGAEAQLGYTEIRSPIDGFVTDRPYYAGETAPSGAPLVTVMETNTLLAKAHIAQAEAQRLKLGGDAQVHVPGVENAVPAKIAMISPALDAGSTTVEVWLKIDNRSGKLRAGTPVKAVIAGRTVENALKIPAAAVMTGDSGAKTAMIVAADGTAQPKRIVLGIGDGEDVQVVSGLDASDQVIVRGGYGLDPGTKVKIGAAGGDGSGSGDDK